MKKFPYQSSLQFIQRPELLWNDIGDRKLWRGIQWIRRGPTVPSRLSWNAYQSNIPKPRSGVRWKHGMRRFSEYGNVTSRMLSSTVCVGVGCLREQSNDKQNALMRQSWYTILQWFNDSSKILNGTLCHYEMILSKCRIFQKTRLDMVWLLFFVGCFAGESPI